MRNTLNIHRATKAISFERNLLHFLHTEFIRLLSRGIIKLGLIKQTKIINGINLCQFTPIKFGIKRLVVL